MLRRVLALTTFGLLTLSGGWAAAATDYCQGGTKTIVFLIDRTTAFDEIDRQDLVTGLDPLFSYLGSGDRLIVQSVNDDFNRSARLLDFCKAQCPDAGFIGNLMSTCSTINARRDLVLQKDEVARVMMRVLQEIEQYERSDIMATIGSVSKDLAFATQAGRTKPLRMMILFSDLLENSQPVPWPQITQSNPRTKAKFAEIVQQGALTGVDVVAFGVGRSHAPVRPALDRQSLTRVDENWREFFRVAGAKSFRVVRRLE